MGDSASITADGIFRVALTGGIASGKTTVADMFGNLGATLIDTDVVARQVVAPGTDGLRAIVKCFGDEVLDADGSLDRPRMRRLVFADEGKRRQLEAITHPLIRRETERQMQASNGVYQIVVVPLLVESPLKDRVDRILVVDCAESVQYERLLARDAESERQARRIIAAQADRAERLAIADDVVLNDADLEQTRHQVIDLHQRYLRLAAELHA